METEPIDKADKSSRTALYLIVLGVLTIGLYIAVYVLGDARLHALNFQYLFWALFVIYIAAVVVAFKTKSNERHALIVILTIAVVVRLIMVFSPPTLSDDIYRYAWDGKIQAHGFDPYHHTADDPALRPFRDHQIYDRLCDRYLKQSAVYPPLAEGIFFITALPDLQPIFLIKLVFALFDIGSLWLLVLILRRLKLNPERVVIYAWSPLVVLEISQSGHIEGLAIFLVLASVLAVLRGKEALAGGMAALAVAAKFVPAIFLPALYRKRDWRFPVAFAATFLFICFPYISATHQLFGMATEFKNLPNFNAGLRTIVEAIFDKSYSPNSIYSLLSAALLAGVGFWIWLRQDGSDTRTMNGLFVMAALFIVVTPFMPSWYMIIIVPFLAWRPSPAFLYLSGAVMLPYLMYLTPSGGPAWPVFVEYIVFFSLLVLELTYVRFRREQARAPVPSG